MHGNSSGLQWRTNGSDEDERAPVASSSGRDGAVTMNDNANISQGPVALHQRAPTRADILLREYRIQQSQNKKALESARSRDPLQNLAEISKRLGANSGMIRGPAQANLADAANNMSPRLMAMKTGAKSSITAGSSTKKITNPVTFVRKAVPKPSLSWTHQDDRRESRVRLHKRSRETGGLGEDDEPIGRFARMRIVNVRANATRPQREGDNRPPKAYLAPQLTLKKKGKGFDWDSSSGLSSEEMDVDLAPVQVDIPSPSQTGRKKTAFRKVAASSSSTTKTVMSKQYPLKAARKTDFTFTDSDSGGETEGTETSSEELEIERGAQPKNARVKVEEEDALHFGPAELIVLDSPPQITIPLPQLGPGPSQTAQTSLKHSIISGPENLAHSGSPLHRTRQLPFLIRNVRHGFYFRCKALGVSLEPELQEVTFRVRHDNTVNTHETTSHQWECPLCFLHDAFPNHQVLQKHLAWDHGEFLVEWKVRPNNIWILTVSVRGATSNDKQNESTVQQLPKSPENRRDSLFPFVTLSPPSTPQATSHTAPHAEAILPPMSLTPETSMSPDSTPSPKLSAVLKGKQPMYPASLPSTASRFSSTSRAQSSTMASSTTVSTIAATSRMASSPFVGRNGRQYPAPPPPDDPLGPSATPPYLPAEPDDPSGQTVYYSCRPGGPTVCDLLNTLSMGPFGVLDWAVLDREEEIFESDEALRDEHKVMHALWARWILLNRRKFIADFHKGAQAFVDEYWKMIHRAAGWDALRYWLILLMANRFLTAKEVAMLLKHYESLTGMDHWYE